MSSGEEFCSDAEAPASDFAIISSKNDIPLSHIAEQTSPQISFSKDESDISQHCKNTIPTKDAP